MIKDCPALHLHFIVLGPIYLVWIRTWNRGNHWHVERYSNRPLVFWWLSRSQGMWRWVNKSKWVRHVNLIPYIPYFSLSLKVENYGLHVFEFGTRLREIRQIRRDFQLELVMNCEKRWFVYESNLNLTLAILFISTFFNLQTSKRARLPLSLVEVLLDIPAL